MSTGDTIRAMQGSRSSREVIEEARKAIRNAEQSEIEARQLRERHKILMAEAQTLARKEHPDLFRLADLARQVVAESASGNGPDLNLARAVLEYVHKMTGEYPA